MTTASPALKWIEIDLAGIRANIRWTLSRLKAGVSLVAVVKADAYGHGAVPVAKTVLAAGASSLGVLTIDEARALRAAGLNTPIELLAPVLPGNAREAVHLKAVAPVDGVEQARALAAAAGGRPVAVKLEMDGGLGRWGASPKDIPALADAVARLKPLRLVGLSTHIDYVPGENAVEAEEKLRAFARIAKTLKAKFPGLKAEAANSSVLLDFPHWSFDRVRIGNLLYGISPARKAASGLRNPWKFLARVVALRTVEKGRPIGYAAEFIPSRRMRLATVPAGYADGLTMEPAQRLISLGQGFRYWAMVRGRPAPYVGRCAISHVLLDVTRIPGIHIGEPMILPVRRTAANSQLPRIYRGS